MATFVGVHHIALTVSDVERSTQWYCDLLGTQVVFHHEDDTVRFNVLLHPGSGWLLGLRQYSGRPADQFDEYRVGMDHVAFAVTSAEELQVWEHELAQRGVTFTPTAETPLGSVVVFRDPDHIQLEFWLPPES